MQPLVPKRKETTALLSKLSSNHIDTIGNYKIDKTIGEGTFGKVKLATHIFNGQQVAIKIVDKIHAPAVEREISTWKHLRHPNIAQLYEVICSESKIYMITEYCSGGEVLDFICQNGKMDDVDLETKRTFWQIVDGVRYCHERNFAHRDLKLENILLGHDSSVKIIDFGFTRAVDSNKLLDTFCGSSAYAAPEIISAKKYSGKLADIWSLGIVFFTLMCGYLPFDEDKETETHKKIVDMDYKVPDFLSNESKNLLENILSLEPTKRPSASEILCHPWFDILYQDSPHLKSYNPTDAINATSEEYIYMTQHFEALGFDVGAIHESVKKDKCDALSSLWYLTRKLIHKEGMHSLDTDVSNIKIISRSNSTAKSPTKEEVMALAAEANRRRLSEGKVRGLHRNIEPEESKYKSRPNSAGSIISRSTTHGRKSIKEVDEEEHDF